MLPLFTSEARHSSNKLLHKSSKVLKGFENFRSDKDIAIIYMLYIIKGTGPG